MTVEKLKARGLNLEALIEEDRDLLKELLREAMQTVLEAEMTDCLGAAPDERTLERRGYRAGAYPRTLVTRVGAVELKVPRDREGRFSTELFNATSAAKRRWYRPCRVDSGQCIVDSKNGRERSEPPSLTTNH